MFLELCGNKCKSSCEIWKHFVIIVFIFKCIGFFFAHNCKPIKTWAIQTQLSCLIFNTIHENVKKSPSWSIANFQNSANVFLNLFSVKHVLKLCYEPLLLSFYLVISIKKQWWSNQKSLIDVKYNPIIFAGDKMYRMMFCLNQDHSSLLLINHFFLLLTSGADHNGSRGTDLWRVLLRSSPEKPYKWRWRSDPPGCTGSLNLLC